MNNNPHKRITLVLVGVIATALFVVAIATRTAPESTVTLTSAETDFLEAIDAAGLSFALFTDSELLDIGHLTCDTLFYSASRQTVVDELVANGFSDDMADVFIDASVDELCPEQRGI